MKVEGNDNFRAQEWSAALVSYRTGLSKLPARKGIAKGRGKEKATDDDDDANSAGKSKPDPDQNDEVQPISAIEAECAKARAVLNANIGACHVKLVSDSKFVCT